MHVYTLQVRTGLDKPDLDIANSTDSRSGLPPLNNSFTTTTQPINENTITINSISRPIPAPVHSPPPDHTHVGSFENTSETHAQYEVPIPPISDIDNGHIDESTAQEYSSTIELVGFQPVISNLESPSLNEPVSNLNENLSLSVNVEPLPGVVAVSQSESSPTGQPVMPQEEPDELPQSVDTQGLRNEQLLSNVMSNFQPILTEDLPNSVSELGTPTALPDNFSSTSSLPQISETISAFQSFSAPTTASLSLSTPPPAVSPLPPELMMPLQDYHSISSIATVAHVDTSHLESKLADKDLKIDELKLENEKQKSLVSDQRVQIESYKQQLLLLQQQVTQVAALQQKQEQEKIASSGQQAVLMQLLQQQQGMFSQQQSQLENMSKVTEAHRKERQELESSYKQALAIEKEQKNSLQNQLTQQMQEMQRYQQQLQSQAQQYQTLQMQLHQYHTQIQERDKQLIAFRDQHKTILQSMDQKHQAKISQLMQQLQDYQAELKKLRTIKQPGIMTPLPPMPSQFVGSQQQPMRPPLNVPGQMAPPVRQPTSFVSQLPPNPTPSTPQQGFNQPGQTPHPLTPQSARPPPQNHPQNFSGGSGPPQRLPPPLQPTPSQGYVRQDSQSRFQQGQNFQAPQHGILS